MSGFCFAAASLVLRGARLLLRLGLITPDCPGSAFGLATACTRRGLQAWQTR